VGQQHRLLRQTNTRQQIRLSPSHSDARTHHRFALGACRLVGYVGQSAHCVGSHQGSRGYRTDADALPGTRQSTLPLPQHQAGLQVVKVEMTTFHKAFREAEHLRGIVSPGTTRQIERPTGKQIAHGTESSTSAVLHWHTERIANGKTEQQTAITFT
jgi:hypothetical protein